MKLLKSFMICAAAGAALVSCNDYLDINVDPNTPSADANVVENMLGWCQFYENHAYFIAGMRTTMQCGYWTMAQGSGTYGLQSSWAFSVDAKGSASCATTPYQWGLVGAGATFGNGTMDPQYGGMYYKAMSQEAWHYAAAAKFLRAYTYMMLTDIYGEMPYSQGLGESALPAYDTGKEIFLGCMEEIDEAIELFQRAQDPTRPSLSLGDSWNGGDTQKWLKLCYLMKARWINHLSKKSEGSYKDGKYDPATILDCLSKAMQSNKDNTIVPHNDNAAPTLDVLGWYEPVDYNPLYSVIGMNSNYYVSKNYVDNLTNFRGQGIEDPRADKFIPWAMSKKSENSPANLVFKGDWRRSEGVDLLTDAIRNKHPYTTSWNTKFAENRWHIALADPGDLAGDTIYIQERCDSKGYRGSASMILHLGSDMDGRSGMSGVWWTRPSAPSFVGSYAECCFIKAEVLFKKGDKSGAFAAYKEGIKASIDATNDQCIAWINGDSGNANFYRDCPSFTPMAQADIDNFLNNAIGSASTLTLGNIMTQKKIAMGFSLEVYNDMRRYDYSSDIFEGYARPYESTVNTTALRYIPMGKFPRRWPQCSHELTYNMKELNAIGAKVPGANYSEDLEGKGLWNNPNINPEVWTVYVWWDDPNQD